MIKQKYIQILKLIERKVKSFDIPLEKEINLNTDPFQILIAIVLSSRTKDLITAKVIRSLFKKVKKPEDLQFVSLKDIEKMIYPVGFYQTKAKHLKKLAQLLIKQYNSQLPRTMNELLTLPGVGRKTANLFLSKVFNQPAICVDVHVQRITNRLAFIQTKTPEQTETALQKIFPEKYWSKINTILVKFGQNICYKRNPQCHICPVYKYCLYYQDNIK